MLNYDLFCWNALFATRLCPANVRAKRLPMRILPLTASVHYMGQLEADIEQC